MSAPVRRSARIAKLNEMKQIQKYQHIIDTIERPVKQVAFYEPIQKVAEQPRGYDCKQMSFMIADLTLALVNLACIIRWIYW